MLGRFSTAFGLCARAYSIPVQREAQSTHRGAIANFWRAFYDDGKISPAGEDGGERTPHFTVVTIMSEVAVYAPAERADTLPVFHLYSI